MTVDVVQVDDALPEELRADVVKLDVEGAELDALHGMERLLERSRPGPTLFVECNPPLLERGGTSPAELVTWLERRGFEARWIDERDGSLRSMSDDDRPGGYVNPLCRRAAT